MAWFILLTMVFVIVSIAMTCIILVQRPSGGGLAGAFGGSGGGGTDTVFGGRVGDALTWATVGAFVVYLGMAVTLNLLPAPGTVATPPALTTTSEPAPVELPEGDGLGGAPESDEAE